MKKKLFFVLASLLTPLTFATDMNCGGSVTVVMGDHPTCEGHMAFKTDKSLDKWMCTKSNEAGSIVLTALTAGKSIAAYIDNNNAATCSDLPHYRKISYVIIYP